MDTEYGTPFSKAVLTGVFTGIVTTLICLGYDVWYRERTGFSLSELINVSSLIFLVNLMFLFFGLVYFFFSRWSGIMGDVFYMMFMALLTLFAAFKSASVHRSDVSVLNSEFQHLLIGIVLIIGIAGTFGVPWLFHSKRFEEHVI